MLWFVRNFLCDLINETEVMRKRLNIFGPEKLISSKMMINSTDFIRCRSCRPDGYRICFRSFLLLCVVLCLF